MEDYKIVATIKGKKYNLNKVGEPTFLMREKNELMQKFMLRDYVYSNFKDIADSNDDITQIVYKKGRKNIMNLKYKTKDEEEKDFINFFLQEMLK